MSNNRKSPRQTKMSVCFGTAGKGVTPRGTCSTTFTRKDMAKSKGTMRVDKQR